MSRWLLKKFGNIGMIYKREMKNAQVIKTKRLLIEPFVEKYLTRKYVSWLNNPQVVRYSEQRHKKHTLASCRKYLETFKKSPHCFWAVSVKDSGLGHIGNINAYIDECHKIADVGILIGDIKAWGNGYATEAWMAVCVYLIKKLKMRKITAGTLSVNKPMLRLMKRSGMREDGRRNRQYLWEGKEVDMIHVAMFKGDLE